MVLTMRNGPAEVVVVGVVGLLKAQPMSDLGNPKGVAGARRNPRKRCALFANDHSIPDL